MAKRGEVFAIAMLDYDFAVTASDSDAEAESAERFRTRYAVGWPDVQDYVWRWVWVNRKMVILKVWFWEWKLSQVRGEIFEKAFGPCPFNWKAGPG